MPELDLILRANAHRHFKSAEGGVLGNAKPSILKETKKTHHEGGKVNASPKSSQLDRCDYHADPREPTPQMHWALPPHYNYLHDNEGAGNIECGTGRQGNIDYAIQLNWAFLSCYSFTR